MSEKVDILQTQSDQDELRSRITLSVTILASSVLILYGIINLFLNKLLPGLFEIFIGILVLSVNLYFLEIKKEYTLPASLISIITLLLSLYLFWNGGFNKTGIFWCLVFPGLFVSTRGVKRGIVWISVHIFSLGVLFLFSSLGSIDIAYSGGEALAALAAYGFSCIILFSYEGSRQKSKKEINMLQGLLPICSYCKKIRDKDGKWEAVENYFYSKRDIDFSHGVCPECLKTHYSEFADIIGDNDKKE